MRDSQIRKNMHVDNDEGALGEKDAKESHSALRDDGEVRVRRGGQEVVGHAKENAPCSERSRERVKYLVGSMKATLKFECGSRSAMCLLENGNTKTVTKIKKCRILQGRKSVRPGNLSA